MNRFRIELLLVLAWCLMRPAAAGPLLSGFNGTFQSGSQGTPGCPLSWHYCCWSPTFGGGCLTIVNCNACPSHPATVCVTNPPAPRFTLSQAAGGCGQHCTTLRLGVKQCITGFTKCVPATLHFKALSFCLCRCVNAGTLPSGADATVGTCFSFNGVQGKLCFLQVSAFQQNDGGRECSFFLSDGTGSCIDCFSFVFTPTRSTVKLSFDLTLGADYLRTGAGDGPSLASMIPQITITQPSSTAPEIDPQAERLPMAALAAMLLILVDRRRC